MSEERARQSATDDIAIRGGRTSDGVQSVRDRLAVAELGGDANCGLSCSTGW